MKRIELSLAQKMWLTISVAIIGTILFSFFFSHYFYEKVYVANVESSLIKEGERLASDYTGGQLTADFTEKIEWYNSKSLTEVVIVQNPRELSACLPFDIDFDSLIGGTEREQLLKGEIISKLGYEERFDRNIMGIIVPLLDGKRLEGIIYLYIPLASIKDITTDAAVNWSPIAVLFLIVTILVGKRIVDRITRPLKEMEAAAYKMSTGDYSKEVPIVTNDEIGRLGRAFNVMAKAVAEEDHKKKEFLANVSHELRTPLSYVKGYSEAIIDGVIDKKADIDKYLKLIHRETGRMQRLVRDLLDLARFEGETYPLKLSPIVISQLVEDTLEKYKPILAEKQLSLTANLDPEIIVNADHDRMEQVIHNVLDNAISYTASGGEIRMLIEQDGANCLLKVEDTGIGIEEEQLEQLGERFFRVNKARTRQDGGTGLGLAIVKKITQLHDGEIAFKSKVGIGTTVLIKLPMVE